MNKKQKGALLIRDMYRTMAESPAFIKFAADNGQDAVIPVCGISMQEIKARLLIAEERI